MKLKKTLALLLSVIMVVAMMPVSGYGATSSSDKFKIGEDGYGTWAEVEMKLKDGDIVEVLQNPGSITINVMDTDFTLDLNGYTMETTMGLTPKGPIVVTSAGHVTIKNGIIQTALEADTIEITQAECVTFEDVTIANNGGKYAIDLAGGTVEFITAEVSTTGTKAFNKASGTTVKWGKQTAAPDGWSTAASFTAAITTDYEATLDGVGYARVNDALKDVQNDSVVTLLKDVGSTTVDAAEKTFTFDLNNHTISDDLWVKAVGELSVKNGSVVGNQSYNFFWIETGTVYLENVNVDQLDWGNREAPIYNKGTLHIYSGEFRILDDGVPIDDPDAPAIVTAAGGTTTVDTGSIVEPADWESASCFTVTYNPVVEVRDSASATTGTKYADIQTAIDEGEGDYLYLLKNVSEVKDLLFNEDEATVFDLGQYTLTMKAGGYISIYDPVTLKNGTIKLLNKDSTGGIYVDAEGSNVAFDNLTVLSELPSFIQVSRGNLVLGAGNYQASGTAKTGFCVYEPGVITIKDGYATDLPEEEWEEFASMHIGKSIENGAYVISGLAESYIYQGEAVTPTVVVKNTDRNAELAVQQYNTIFSDNNQLGKAKVTIIGKNNFGGKLEANFNLLPCAPDSITVTPFENFPDSALTVTWTHPQAEQVSVYKLELYDGNDKLKEVTASTHTVTFGDLSSNKEYTVVITPGVNIDNATIYSQASSSASGRTQESSTTAPEPVHDWTAADCNTPKTCKICGATEGTALGHDWTAADCDTAKTCKTCGATEGAALGHDWKAATCDAAKTCKTCGTTEGSALGHDWKAATCTAPKTCKTCGATEGTALGHDWKAATCDTAKTCKTCGKTEGAALGHSAGTAEVTKQATTSKNGELQTKCRNCGKVLSRNSINKASKVSLSKASYTYNGKTKSPKVVVKDSKGNTISSKYYTVSKPSGRKAIGKYTYTVKFKGNYTGTKKLTLTIKPVKPTIQTPKAAKKAITVKWKKGKKAQVTGYEVIVATNNKFTKGKKTATVKGYSKVSKKVTGLKAKTKYYVKVRTYKTVKGVKIYSDWSKVKTIKTK